MYLIQDDYISEKLILLLKLWIRQKLFCITN